MESSARGLISRREQSYKKMAVDLNDLFIKYLLLEELVHLHEVVSSFVLGVCGESHLGGQSLGLLD